MRSIARLPRQHFNLGKCLVLCNLVVLTAKKSGKTSMESEGSNCESSKNDSTRGEDFENHEKVKDRVRKAENTEKVETTKEISCQTDFDDILHQHLEQFEDDMQLERDEMEKEFIEEKSNLEIKLRNEYNEIIKKTSLFGFSQKIRISFGATRSKRNPYLL